MSFTHSTEDLVLNSLHLEELLGSPVEQKLLESRSIFLTEAVTAKSAKKIVTNLLFLDQQSKDPIKLFINSPGGEVNSGFSIYDTIRFIESDVTIITCGLCASIATIINIAVEPKKRLALPNSKFLIHQPLISGLVRGQASDLEITATQIENTRQKINQLLAQKCDQPLEKVTEDTKRDYWMSAQESLDYGLIGRIIERSTEL
jgi:ATP-dependent Clp protease protease subunit